MVLSAIMFTGSHYNYVSQITLWDILFFTVSQNDYCTADMPVFSMV